MSTGNTAGGSEAEEKIKSQYPEQTGLELTTISCDSTDAETGKVFSCEATNEANVDLKIEGTVGEVDSDEDRFKFRWEVTGAVAAGDAYAEPALTELRSKGLEIESLACPDGIEIKKGTVVTCTATSPDGEERDAELTLTDGDGGFRITVK